MAGSQRAVTTPTPAHVAQRFGRVAVFDLDRTLLPGSSLVALGREMASHGLLQRHRLLTAMARDASFRRRGATDAQADGVCAAALRHVAGLEVEVLRSLVDAVARRLAGEVRPGARHLLRRHLLAGDFVVVLSASPQELVEAVAARIGAHRGVGTRADVAGGCYTGRLIGPFCYGDGKVARLQHDVGGGVLRDATAYADSGSDLPVLEACREPVAVNPDGRLRWVAERRGWPVLVLW
jgi:HAD superfamily hydrolase (TIGR01490 family)